jgi:uncharacterized RDD family membrane protein YckC
MYCFNCGLVAHKADKFCTNCGQNLELVGKSTNTSKWIQDILEGVKSNPRARAKLAIYIIWIMIHFVFSQLEDSESAYRDELWFFNGFEYYGLIDFIFYTLAPILLYIVFKLISKPKRKPVTSVILDDDGIPELEVVPKIAGSKSNPLHIKAKFRQRAVAFIIDKFFITLIISPFYNEFDIVQNLLVFIFVVDYLYYVIFEGSCFKGTLGKYFVSIKTVDKSGKGLSYIDATIRCMARHISIVTIVGVLIPIFNKDKQTLHDQISETNVLMRF